MNRSRTTILAGSIAAAIAVSVAHAEQAWVLQAPHPYPPQDAPEVGFLTPQLGYMTGMGPITLKTTDGGMTWNPVGIPGTAPRRIFVFDEQHAWTFGPGGYARTTNGGAGWQPLGYVNGANDAIFLSPSFGWVSDNWAVSVTHDGGFTWTHGIINSTTRIVYPSFMNESVGIGMDDDRTRLYRTTDGGESWTAVLTEPSNGYNSFHRVQHIAGDVFIATGYSRIYRSTDAGQTWQVVADDPQIPGRILAFDESTVIVWSASDIFRSTDAGVTWTHIPPPHWPERMTHTQGLEAYGYNAWGEISRTRDGGATWTLLYDAPDFGFSSFAVPEPGHLIAVGPSQILHSFDDGATWTQSSSGTGYNINAICMSENGVGFTVGDFAAVCKTVNGGEQWLLNSRPGLTYAEGVDMAGDLVIVVGQQGTAARSTDGGATWEPMAPGDGLGNDIDLIDEQTGWIARGYSGTGYVQKTTDGGVTWTNQIGPVPGGFRAIQFADASLGWSLHSEGLVVRTTDGGENWVQHLLPTDADSDMRFADRDTGWCAGGYGQIVRTTNGGLSWSVQNSGTSQLLWSVYAVSPQEAWVGGSNNTLLHTTNGGQTWEQVTIDLLGELNASVAITAIEVNTDGSIWLGTSGGLVLHRPGETQPVAGDVTGDGVVNVDDLVAVITGWGCNGACDADVAPAPGGDGQVNVDDLVMVIVNWG